MQKTGLNNLIATKLAPETLRQYPPKGVKQAIQLGLIALMASSVVKKHFQFILKLKMWCQRRLICRKAVQ